MRTFGILILVLIVHSLRMSAARPLIAKLAASSGTVVPANNTKNSMSFSGRANKARNVWAPKWKSKNRVNRMKALVERDAILSMMRRTHLEFVNEHIIKQINQIDYHEDDWKGSKSRAEKFKIMVDIHQDAVDTFKALEEIEEELIVIQKAIEKEKRNTDQIDLLAPL
jgi:hypothetical protein